MGPILIAAGLIGFAVLAVPAGCLDAPSGGRQAPTIPAGRGRRGVSTGGAGAWGPPRPPLGKKGPPRSPRRALDAFPGPGYPAPPPPPPPPSPPLVQTAATPRPSPPWC